MVSSIVLLLTLIGQNMVFMKLIEYLISLVGILPCKLFSEDRAFILTVVMCECHKQKKSVFTYCFGLVFLWEVIHVLIQLV